ncbi:MAG: TonB-dependent receptor [Crocinitomicaceae bacterium]|nr:TonB-dependent receptor [Crocinitomicaceae bacterium]
MKLSNFSGMYRFLLCLFVVLSSQTFAQNDSILPKIFGFDDLDTTGLEKNKLITSANLLAESPDDLSQEVFIITGDEIRRKGFTTLVDILKTLPGFRTSQPGNAMEGETFLMRGLYGNDHTKILINGIPIKPEAVRGMPISAQLPVRHAERIEIVMGPSAAAYGSDAMAGVINIVLPEVDRPVFAWADINLMNYSASEINLTLGGKIGKGKNILNYELFASSYSAGDQNIFIPRDSIRIIADSLSSDQQQLFFNEPEDPNLPEIDYLPKESRFIGAYLKFRWFEVGAMNMYRQDQSAIGSFPTVHSYHVSNLIYGEEINNFFLKYHSDEKKRFQSKASLSALYYRTLEESSYYGVTNFLSNGKNFRYARSLDTRFEYQGVLKMNKRMNLVVGAIGQYSVSNAFTDFLGNPVRYDELSFQLPSNIGNPSTAAGASATQLATSLVDTTTYIPLYSALNVAGFAQYSFRSKNGKFNAIVGTRVDFNAYSDSSEVVFTPKVGVAYKLNKKWRFRAFYGSGYRAPRSYHLYNNYSNLWSEVNNSGARLERGVNNLNAEKLQGGEIGFKWKPSEVFSIDGTYFIHQLENRMLRQANTPPQPGPMPPPPDLTVGFSFFNGDSYALLHSGLLNFNLKKDFGTVELNAMLSYQYATGIEIVEQEDNTPSTNVTAPGYRYMPTHSVKGNFGVEFYGFNVNVNTQFWGDYLSEVFRVNSTIEYASTTEYFFNLDLSIHKELFRQLSFVGTVTNLLGSVQSGISSVTVSDSWSYNPQYGRNFKIGLTFKLN